MAKALKSPSRVYWLKIALLILKKDKYFLYEFQGILGSNFVAALGWDAAGEITQFNHNKRFSERIQAKYSALEPKNGRRNWAC